MKNKIVIGSRKSRLALFQTGLVREMIEKHFPSIKVSIWTVTTTGDRILDKPLAKIGDKGLFTKELEDALFKEEIDLAVHSLKDLPTKLPADLEISSYSKREECRDCVISTSGAKLKDLPAGAKVGTSSLRRISQLLSLRPDLKILDLRGNVETRLRKLDEGEFDAIVIAAAGLIRLGFGDRITEILDPAFVTPAAGQGIIAVENKKGRNDLNEILKMINDPDSELMAKAERELLNTFGGGCRVPIGAMATICGDEIKLSACVGSLDGKDIIRNSIVGNKSDAEKLGLDLAHRMLEDGAACIIERTRHDF